MKRLIRTIVSAMLIVLFGPVCAANEEGAPRRVALVIGNSSYSFGDLVTPSADAREMADTLRELGFQVDLRLNASRAQMMESLQRYARDSAGAEMSVIYYAGHAIGVEGRNWLLPTDIAATDVRSSADLVFGAIDADLLQANNSAKYKITIFDSSRDNPIARTVNGGTRSFTRGMVEDFRVENMAVMMAAPPGMTASDGKDLSPLATALVRNMKEPGLAMPLLFAKVSTEVAIATGGLQRPWFSSSLPTNTYFASPKGVAFSNQPRLALVIGQSDYNRDGDVDDRAFGPDRFAPDLPNPVNDARDLKSALERIRFSVDIVENADYQTLLAGLFAFEKKVIEAGPDALVVIHYSGHAIQVGGANFLIPVGAKLPAEDPRDMLAEQAELLLSQYALPLQSSLMGRLRQRSAKGLNLLILDACRENPWETRAGSAVRGERITRGLADVRTGLTRTVVAYATKAGDVADDGEGRNSPYTAALLTLIERPGLSVPQLMDAVNVKVNRDTGGRQTPFSYGPGIGSTCLGACEVQ